MYRSGWLAFAGAVFLAANLQAATFLVNDNGTASDAAIDGNCLTAGGVCTLRAAIQEANATLTLDVINFSGSMTIVESALPIITEPVRIDGQTSAVVIEGTPITLGGTSDGSRILRLTIRNSPSGGILINSAGVMVAGNTITANQLFGVRATSANATIGGDGDGDANVISGTTSGSGVEILAGPASIIANTITTNATHGISIVGDGVEVRSNVVSGNAGTGILLNGTTGATIEANVVSANGAGIILQDGSANTFHANFIGTDLSGTADLGNAGTGLRVIASNAAASQNTISTNVVAFNLIGIEILEDGSQADQNRLTTNQVFDNDESGVDLARIDGDPGPTLNDPGDADTGANDFQNFPEITCISGDGSSTTFMGTLGSQPSTAYRIEIFSNAACQSSSGRTYLGFTDVTTDAGGSAAINVTLPVGLPVGTPVTATATDPNGNTSEYSACGFVADGALVIQPQYLAGEADGTATITVTRGAVPEPATVDYAVTNGTATASADFTAVNGTLTFAACETTKSFTVPILDDNIDEPDEAATITFSNSSTSTLVIQDDDATPIVTMTPPTASMAENGGTATLTFSLDHPSSQDITVPLSFSGTASGSDYSGAVPSVVIPALQTTATLTLTAINDTTQEGDETVVVNGASQTSTITIVDDDPVPSASINDVPVTEGGTATFTVTLSNPSTSTITVDFTTANVTAIAGSDYAATSGQLTFAPGVTTQPISVTTTGDNVDEPDETFEVRLPAATGIGTITDDDPLPAATINSVAVTEGGTATFTVTLSNPSASTITVDYTTANVTATAGTDYVAATGQVTFAPGVTTQPVSVTTTGDNLDEPDETFEVRLPAATGTGTILDDDGVPSITINSVAVTEGGTATFTVTLSNPSASTIVVDYTTANVTAIAGSDYVAASGQVTFAPGVTTQPISVTTIGDTVFEGNETFEVRLPAATGTGTILDDEGQADVSIVKSGPPAVAPDAPFAYTITVSNAGPDPATNATMTDVLPAGLTFDSATASQGSCSGTSTVICTLGTLAAGQAATVTLTVRAAAGTTITNTATVLAAEHDPTPGNGSSTTATAVIGGNVPALSEWMLLALAALLAGIAVMKVR